MCLFFGVEVARSVVPWPWERRAYPVEQVKWVNLDALRGKRVAFQTNHLDYQGTGRALYDYADLAQTLFGVRPLIFSKNHSANSNAESIARFTHRFDVVFFTHIEEVRRHLENRNNDVLSLTMFVYQTGDLDTSKWPIPVIQLAIFKVGARGTHVDVRISEIIQCPPKRYCPVLPHVVRLPFVAGNWRRRLRIADNHIVFCRHGGLSGFDKESHQAVEYTLQRDLGRRVYFLLLNTNKNAFSHPRKIHLPAVASFEKVREFINTCDAMMYGSPYGETFGLAIAEFSYCNKPIVIADRHWKGFHTSVLGNGAIRYKTKEQFADIAFGWNKTFHRTQNYYFYSQFLPRSVMQNFYDLALRPFINF